MTRLYRPSIPLAVKCRVVMRQLGEMFIEDVLAAHPGKLKLLLSAKMTAFAIITGCEVSDLRLDHDPPLAARPRERRGLGRVTYYMPDANDPDHLFYRPHGAQFEGSHDVKTRIRGDHGQFSDIQLIKRQRRRERGPKPKKPVANKGFAKKSSKLAKQKQRIPSRPFPKRSK